MKKSVLIDIIKEAIKELTNEQGGGPIPRYRIDAGGCIQCPPNVGPSQCPYTDPNCGSGPQHDSDYGGGHGHPGGGKSNSKRAHKFGMKSAKKYNEGHCYNENGDPIPEAHCSEAEIKEQRANTHYKGNCCEWCDDLAAGRAIGNYPPVGCEDWNCNECTYTKPHPSITLQEQFMNKFFKIKK